MSTPEQLGADGITDGIADGIADRTADGMTDSIADSTLRRFADRVAADPEGARADLLAALHAAKGPLLEAEPPGRVRVTFVAVGPTEPPAVRCALFDGLEPSVPMAQVAGTTDVWWADVVAADDVSVGYQLQRHRVPMPSADDGPVHDPEVMQRLVAEMQRAGYADPFNPDSYPFEEPAEIAVREQRMPVTLVEEVLESGATPWESALTLPGAAPYPWHDPAAPAGTLRHRRLSSAVLGNTRTVAVWTPPGARAAPDAPTPVVVLLDGEAMHGRRARVERIFANLIASGATAPFVGVLVHNASEMSRMQEYPCRPEFATFLADELLPELRAELPITQDPAGVVIGGFSYGGLAADFAALTRPDAFGAALSMSASLWWGIRPPTADPSDDTQGRDDAPEWLTRQLGPAPANAARFWLDVGLLEDTPIPFADGVSQLSANRAFRDALLRNGYRVVGYREQPGGHDLFNWRRTLPDGLIALLGAPGDHPRPAVTLGAGSTGD
ncbi:MAG TPA: alpha/beta hydrolase-fold protein [Nakamurella sp.]|nr:alpha/beta hydrolase-fold protein [Nakamurella sp.]